MSTEYAEVRDKDGASISVEGAQIRGEVRLIIQMPGSGSIGMLNLNEDNARILHHGFRLAFEHAFGFEP